MCKIGIFKGNIKKVVTFFLKSQIYKHITHSSDNSIISIKLHFVQYGFLLGSGHGPIYEGGGGIGQGRKPKLNEENRESKNIKVQKMHKKSEIICVKKVLILTADLSIKWWVGTSDRTGQNSLKLVHSLLKSGHDRKID